MPIDYTALRDTAKALLESFGAPRVITLERDGPTTGTEFSPTPGVVISQQVVGVVLPASQNTLAAFDDRFDGDTLVDEKLRYVILAADGQGLEPQGGDRLRFDDAVWHILGVTPVSPGGVPIIYRMGAQRIK